MVTICASLIGCQCLQTVIVIDRYQPGIGKSPGADDIPEMIPRARIHRTKGISGINVQRLHTRLVFPDREIFWYRGAPAEREHSWAARAAPEQISKGPSD